MASLFLTRWARLYSDPTPAERALEPAVAALGRPYRFQHPLWHLGYFPDFALTADRVIFEVDDPGHRRAAARARDRVRTERLIRAGWRVFRCTNAEALADPVAAVARMAQAAGLVPSQVPTTAPTVAGTSAHGTRTHTSAAPAPSAYSAPDSKAARNRKPAPTAAT
jgi:very-short-patch-repair endonuclease